MINEIFLLQPTLSASDFNITTSAGWQVGLLLAIVGTVLFVWRQSSQNNTARVNAEIEAERRDSESRAAQEKALSEVRANYDKLMNDTRIQMADERNLAQKQLIVVNDKFTGLQQQFIESQASTIRMQGELTASRKSEETAVLKATELEATVKSLQTTMTGLQQQLTEANGRIDVLSKENKDLQNKVQSISTGSVPKVENP